MINILNNKLKFKEKYLSLHKNSNINPKNFNNILKRRIKSLYSFSYNLNKFSKNNPSLVFKGLPYLTKGFGITETERVLKLSPLSRKGLDILKVAPKAKSTFFNPNSNLTINISEAENSSTRANTFNLSSLSLNKEEVGGSGYTSSLIAKNAAKEKTKALKDNRPRLKATPQSELISNRANTKRREIDIERPRSYSSASGLDLKRKYRLPLVSSSASGLGPSAAGSQGTDVVYLNTRPILLAPVAGDDRTMGGTSYNVYKPVSPAMSPDRLNPSQKGPNVSSTRALRGNWSVTRSAAEQTLKGHTSRKSDQSFNGSVMSRRAPMGGTDQNLNKETSWTRSNKGRKGFVNKWKEEWTQKKRQLSHLGAYKPQVSDKNWFTFLDQIRQIIKSKYVFNTLLSRSQSVNYNFNKDYKKINLSSVYKILKSFFTSLSALISKPVFLFTPDTVNIRLFYFIRPTVLELKKERKEKKLIRNKGLLYKEKKQRRQFRQIMQNFRMKLFIARWKESNYLIRLPNLPDTFSKFIAFSNQPYLNEVAEGVGSKGYKLAPIAFSNTVEETRTADLSHINNRRNASVDFMSLSDRALSGPADSLTTSPLAIGGSSYHTPVNATQGAGQQIREQETSRIGILRDSFKGLHTLNTQMFSPTMVSLNKDKLKYLVFILEKAFNKTVILDLIRLKYPYHDSNMLAQVLGLNSHRKNFRQMMRKLLYTATIKNPTKMIRKQNFSIIPSYLSGIKVRLAGRLITQRVVPRFTVQSLQMGSLARGKVNYVDTSRLTLKNKRGAFSFTVTTSHIFENYK